MSTSYRSLAAEVGCLPAEIYREIRRCLRLRGGVVRDGVKWIWKTSEELATLLGCNEKTIRRHLKSLVEMGWLKREQLQKKWGMRAYHYTLGDNAPLKPIASSNPAHSGRSGRSEADNLSGSINSIPRSNNSPTAPTARTATAPLRCAKQPQTEKRPPVAAAVPHDWPEQSSEQQIRLGIEQARNLIDFLRPKPPGFASAV